jgi:nucleoside-diphosphate-sugar epimerase
MRLLITGATGRVGSRYVRRMLQRGDELRLLVRHPERAESLRQMGAEVAVGDLSDPESLSRAVTGIDAVVHLAAFFRGATPAQTQAINLDGTVNLAHASIKAGVPRFIFSSTSLIYGPGRGRAAHEEDIPQPAGAYPATKVAAEAALLALHRTQGLDLRIIRLAFVYGDGDPHLTEGLQWFRTWPLQKRFQMLHHEDVAQAIMLVTDARGIGGRIYNVAEDEPTTTAELLQLQGEPIAPDAAARPLADPWEGIVDTTRIKADLDFRPIYPSLRAAVVAGRL